MTSLLIINFPVLTVITLRTLCALCAPTSPLALSDSPSGEPPSEETHLLSKSPLWDVFIEVTKRHREQFEEEYSNEYNYDFLGQNEIPSEPLGCTVALNKEACLSRLVQGLQVYKVLLAYVKTVYPDNVLANINSDPLIQLLKNEMRHPERVAAVSTVEAENMLRGLDNLTTFHKKLTAHNILRKLHHFLIDSKRDVARKENGRFNQRRQRSQW